MIEITKITTDSNQLCTCTNCCTDKNLNEIKIGVNDRFTRSLILLCDDCLKELKEVINK